MCCEGCAAVATVIHDSGLSGYYRKRTARPKPVNETRALNPPVDSSLFDDTLLQSRFVQELNGSVLEAQFVVQEMHCPACVWLIENRVNGLVGVISATINYSSHKLTVKWDKTQIRLSEIVQTIQKLGYGASPYDRSGRADAIQRLYSDLLRRLGVAGVFGMQVMILAVALYAGAWTTISPQYEELFRRLSLLLILPVLLYAAAPIFRGAVRDLGQMSATMDVPVALGLLIAFLASVYATFSGSGEVYFDSIAMFVFLQLGSRYLEHSAYRRMTDTVDRIAVASPASANRLKSKDDLSSAVVVLAARLKAGDYVLVRPGEVVPADGIIAAGVSEIDESILSGESSALPRCQGETVVGGSYNLTSVLVIEVTHIGVESVLGGIMKLLEDGTGTKPVSVHLTDKIAGAFSFGVVLVAASVAFYWGAQRNPQWIAHTISVLVVACPCALSLAVPTALTAAVNTLVRQGILVSQSAGLLALAKADTFLFDKTGTLTKGHPVLQSVETFGSNMREFTLKIAVALAHASEHPVARALVQSKSSDSAFTAHRPVNVPGGGIRGEVNEIEYFLGSRQFIENEIQQSDIDSGPEQSGLVAYLADEHGVLAKFHFEDAVRENAKETIKELTQIDAQVTLVTGDRESEAKRIASCVGISKVMWGCSPKDKLEIIRGYQKQGRCVAMMGDGINDGPVLAAADVSIAPAGALQAVKISSDVVLLPDRLDILILARKGAEVATRIMRQNAFWAVVYNLAGISLAAAGYVPPIVAAVGMSISSLFVVCNSLRITRACRSHCHYPLNH